MWYAGLEEAEEEEVHEMIKVAAAEFCSLDIGMHIVNIRGKRAYLIMVKGKLPNIACKHQV